MIPPMLLSRIRLSLALSIMALDCAHAPETTCGYLPHIDPKKYENKNSAHAPQRKKKARIIEPIQGEYYNEPATVKNWRGRGHPTRRQRKANK